jgi:hypothetical protein
MKQRIRLLVTAAVAVVALAAWQAAALADGGSRGTIYSSIPKKLPGNVASLGYEATQTKEFGDHVRFTTGSKRKVREVSVVLSSWGCENGAWHTGDWPDAEEGHVQAPAHAQPVRRERRRARSAPDHRHDKVQDPVPLLRELEVRRWALVQQASVTTGSRSRSRSSSGSATSRCPTR